MNYHRRTTRPDAAFYRDSRKISRGGRVSGGKGGVSPLAITIGLVVVIVVAVVYFLLHR